MSVSSGSGKGQDDEQPPPLTEDRGSSRGSAPPTATKNVAKNSDASRKSKDVKEQRNSRGSAPAPPPPKATQDVAKPSDESKKSNDLKGRRSTIHVPSQGGQIENEEARKSTESSELPEELCVLNDTCAVKNTITLGELEKDQLKSVGKHLLAIGKQLLHEMSFVEGLVEKFGFGGWDNENQPDNCGIQPQTAGMCGMDPMSLLKDPPPCENTEQIKNQLVDAIAVQARKLSWIEQFTQDYKQCATNTAHFGSAFGSPTHSNCEPMKTQQSACAKRGSDQATQELRKKLAAVECKMEKMCGQIETVEKRIVDVYKNVQEALAKLSEEINTTRQLILGDSTRLEDSKGELDDKLQQFEGQIIKLAQIVWEIKCETRAQMHFGREYH